MLLTLDAVNTTNIPLIIGSGLRDLPMDITRVNKYRFRLATLVHEAIYTLCVGRRPVRRFARPQLGVLRIRASIGLYLALAARDRLALVILIRNGNRCTISISID